jgi:hypothetical protein
LARKASPGRDKAKEILSYFVRNPKAADTFEGVVMWRLLDQAIHQSVNETRAALDWLVEEGYLREVTSPGSGTIFSLNADRRGDSERFVSSPPGRRKRRPGA